VGKERDQARAWTDQPTDGPPPADATPREANRHRLRTPDGRALYKRRGATVEPGIANLKKIIDRFSRRGLDNATNELHLAATAFNLTKIHRATAVAEHANPKIGRSGRPGAGRPKLRTEVIPRQAP
jgi:hypothetical protein